MQGQGWRAAWGLVAAAVVLISVGPADARTKRVRLRHHGDPVRVLQHAWPKRPIAHAAANTLTDLPATWCGVEQTADVGSPLSNAPQIKVVYAYASDQPDNFTTYKDVIQSDVNQIRERVADDSGDAVSVRFDLGNVAPGGGCGGTPAKKYADIQVVHLPKALATYNGLGSSLVDTLRTDILAAVGASTPGSRTDYVVYADQINRGGGIAGEAQTPIDDSHGYGNGVNRGPGGDGRLFAVIYGFGNADFVGGIGAGGRRASFLHELSHTQGAVQNSAPHSSGAGHCYDERDIMCYNDGGSYFAGGGALTTPCATGVANDFTEAWDCGSDDYFKVSPAAGSYLATHWNVADSIYLCPVASCDSVIGSPTVALGAPDTAFRGSSVTFTASASGMTVLHFEWDLNNDGVYDLDTGTTPSTTQPMTSNGTKTVRVRVTTTDGTFGTDAKTVTVSEPTPPTLSFTVTSGPAVVGKPVVFDASASSDPSGVVTNYKWDLDGNGTFEVDGGTAKTATTTYTTPGTRTITLEADYPTGVSMVSAGLPVSAAATATGPKLRITAGTLGKVIKKGIRIAATCGAACSMTARLTIAAAVAKRLHLKTKKGKPLTVGSASGSAPAAGTLTTTIGLSSTLRRALKRVKSVVMTLNARVTQPGAPVLKVNKSLTLRR